MADTRTRRTYLFPCTGYVSSVPKALCPPGALTEDSREWLLNPISGQLVRRGGSQMIGDTPHNRSSVFESTVTVGSSPPTAWRAIALDSPSMTSGYQVIAGLYSNDGINRYGMIYVRSNNSTATTERLKNYIIGEEFAGNTTSGTYQLVSAEPLLHITSFAYRTTIGTAGTTTSIGRTRLAFQMARIYTAAGSRGVTQVGRNLYLPNLYGQPLAWDKTLNETNVSAANRVYIRPWGHQPPLFAPTQSTATAATGSDVNWEDGDTFYVSVVFKRADGSYSAPYIPRPVAGGLSAAVGGLWTIGTPTTTPSGGYRSVLWTNIPIGPEGTIARILCRSKKIRLTSTTAPLDQISPGKLFVTAIINNNSQTSYTDPNGSDADLVADDRVIRYDHILPPASRYSFEFDGRVAVGYTAPNPAAIFLAPTLGSATRDLNVSDQSATLYGTVGGLFNINIAVSGATPTRTYTFTLRRCSGHTASGGSLLDTTLTTGATTSVQSIIDQINATLGTTVEWAAQLAPGADINALASDLAPTSVTVAACTIASTTIVTTTTAQGFADVAIGMRVTGTGVPAGTYVASISSVTSLVISSPKAATNGAALSLTFWTDTGDDALAVIIPCVAANGSTGVTASSTNNFRFIHAGMAVSGSGIAGGTTVASITDMSTLVLSAAATAGAGTGDLTFTRTGWLAAGAAFPVGNVRAFGPAWPEQVFFRGPYLDRYPIQKRDVYFTVGSPGAASSAVDSFVLPNRRQVPASAGQFMGGAPLASGAVLCFANAIYTLENRRGGSTGEDFDYRTYELNVSRGCISPRSIVAFNGVVGYMTRDGYVVTDGKSERLLSQDVWDPGTRRGSWATEISLAQRYTATDAVIDAFSASVTGTRLHVCYGIGDQPLGNFDSRSRLTYDFSPGAEASGLNSVLRSVGSSETSARAYGWSAPLAHPCGPIAEVVESAGSKFYAVVGSEQTGGGHVEQIDCPIATAHYDKAAYPGQFTVSTISGTPNLTSTFPGGFLNVAVGATALVASVHPWTTGATLTITSKSADGNTAVVSASTGSSNATSTQGGVGLIWYGKEIAPAGYMAMDMVDALREKKVLHRLTAIHKSPSGGTQLLVSRDRLRLSSQAYTLSGTGTAEAVREVVEMNQLTRCAGEVIEVAVTDDGGATTALPEFYGVEAEVEILDSEV